MFISHLFPCGKYWKPRCTDRNGSWCNMRRPMPGTMLPQELEVSHKVRIKHKWLLHPLTEKPSLSGPFTLVNIYYLSPLSITANAKGCCLKLYRLSDTMWGEMQKNEPHTSYLKKKTKKTNTHRFEPLLYDRNFLHLYNSTSVQMLFLPETIHSFGTYWPKWILEAKCIWMLN